MLLIKQKSAFGKQTVAYRKLWYPEGICCLYLTSLTIVVTDEHTSSWLRIYLLTTDTGEK